MEEFQAKMDARGTSTESTFVPSRPLAINRRRTGRDAVQSEILEVGRDDEMQATGEEARNDLNRNDCKVSRSLSPAQPTTEVKSFKDSGMYGNQ